MGPITSLVLSRHYVSFVQCVAACCCVLQCVLEYCRVRAVCCSVMQCHSWHNDERNTMTSDLMRPHDVTASWVISSWGLFRQSATVCAAVCTAVCVAVYAAVCYSRCCSVLSDLVSRSLSSKCCSMCCSACYCMCCSMCCSVLQYVLQCTEWPRQ